MATSTRTRLKESGDARIVPVVVLSVLCCLVELGCSKQPSEQPSQYTYDLVIAGGRVIDPETKLDAVRNVGISLTVTPDWADRSTFCPRL